MDAVGGHVEADTGTVGMNFAGGFRRVDLGGVS
jgi:hypothetical protein